MKEQVIIDAIKMFLQDQKEIAETLNKEAEGVFGYAFNSGYAQAMKDVIEKIAEYETATIDDWCDSDQQPHFFAEIRKNWKRFFDEAKLDEQDDGLKATLHARWGIV